MTDHVHSVFVPGCLRCDISRDEAALCHHENTHFDRSLCGMCDAMHYFCDDCGEQTDPCVTDDSCHCGEPIYYEPAIPGPDPRGFTRGLCATCDAERCDAPQAGEVYTCHYRTATGLDKPLAERVAPIKRALEVHDAEVCNCTDDPEVVEVYINLSGANPRYVGHGHVREVQ